MDGNEQDGMQLEPTRVVELIGDDGKPMPVEVLFEVIVNDCLYALMTPAHPVIVILREDPAGEDAPLEPIEPAEFNEIAKDVQSHLFNLDVQVEVQADEFVLVGTPNDEFYNGERIQIEVEDGDEEYLIIVELDYGGKNYLVALPLDPDPPIYPGEILADEKARILKDEEMEGLQEVFEQVLAEGFAEEE